MQANLNWNCHEVILLSTVLHGPIASDSLKIYHEIEVSVECNIRNQFATNKKVNSPSALYLAGQKLRFEPLGSGKHIGGEIHTGSVLIDEF